MAKAAKLVQKLAFLVQSSLPIQLLSHYCSLQESLSFKLQAAKVVATATKMVDQSITAATLFQIRQSKGFTMCPATVVMWVVRWLGF